MSTNDNSALLNAAVQAIWAGLRRKPQLADADHSAKLMATAQTLGRGVPRQTDKTIAPLAGPRTDIEARATESGRD